MLALRLSLVTVFVAHAAWAAAQVSPPHVAKLFPTGAASGAEFGNAVAVDGDWAVVGAQNDNYGLDPSGTAAIFRRGATGWSQVATLSTAEEWDAFGLSVAISGSIVVVGAWGDDEGAFNAGAAYVYERSEGSGDWTLLAKLTAIDGAPGDSFGFSVAVHKDTIVVGAPLGDSVVDANTGAAYVFARRSDGWRLVQKLRASDAIRGTLFGRSVAVSGCAILVGAPWSRGSDFQSGAAYVFEKCVGPFWLETARLTTGVSSGRFFGGAVALDRGTAVVGENANDDQGLFTGAAYVFGRHAGGLNRWGRLAKLSAFDAERDKNFGLAVAVYGATVVVGAPGDDHAGIQSGAAYVFLRDAGGPGRFGPVAKLTASDAAGFDAFGWRVAAGDSGILVGAPGDDEPPFNSGSAYLFAALVLEPVCRITTTAAAGTVTLDFRLGTPVAADWSVWASSLLHRRLLWSRPLEMVDPPVEGSVTLPVSDWPGPIWFTSVLSTGEHGAICIDSHRIHGRGLL